MGAAAITKEYPVFPPLRQQSRSDFPSSPTLVFSAGPALKFAPPSPAGWMAASFEPINLADMNAGSAMLERKDRKYIVVEADLRRAIALLADHFKILEIEGRRVFTYETCYFDDLRHTNYFDHHQGRRQRCKIRMRKYADVQSCYVEVKLKDKRGITVKKRLDHPIDGYGTLDERAMGHIHAAYREMYDRRFDMVLHPVLELSYQRVSLAAKRGGERVTIDSGVLFSGAEGSRRIDSNIFIMETKSANGNGIADKILRSLHQHPASHCSKYCIGAAVLRMVHKHNNFLPVLRKINAVPRSQEGSEHDLGEAPLFDHHRNQACV
jgi:hypothetical protein